MQGHLWSRSSRVAPKVLEEVNSGLRWIGTPYVFGVHNLLGNEAFCESFSHSSGADKAYFFAIDLGRHLAAQTRVKRTAELHRQELPPHTQDTITRVTLYDLRDGLDRTRSDKLIWFRSKPLQTI